MVMSLVTVFNVPFEDYALFNDPKSRFNFFGEKEKTTIFIELITQVTYSTK